MLGLDLPSGRTTDPTLPTQSTSAVTSEPGATLGLRTADVRADAPTTVVTQAFEDRDGSGFDEFTYLRGADGTVTSPGQPALPLQSISVGVPGTALRGVGFRGGEYTDTAQVIPLTGAPATEYSEVHTTFSSPVFFPRRLAQVNPYGAIDGDGGTRLLVTPAQHRSETAVASTLRRFSSTDFRLMYSANTERYGDNVPALAAPPAITGVSSTVTGSNITVSARVVGDPSAGIQQVWVTRTAEQGPWYGAWSSLDLTQDTADSTLWTGTLALPEGQSAADVRFILQAVNGVGLVTMEDNQGREFVPGTSPGHDPTPTGGTPTEVSLGSATGGHFGGSLPVSATLTSGQALPNRAITLSLGQLSRIVTTDSQGVAQTTFPLTERVGELTLSATFAGDAGAAASRAEQTVTISKRPTTLELDGPESHAVHGEDTGVTATLTAGTTPVSERSVVFVVRDATSVVGAAVRATGPDGTARLGLLDLPSGSLSVTAYFGRDDVDVGNGQTVGTVDAESRPSTSEPLALRVMSKPRIVTSSLADAVAGSPYHQPLVAEGDPAPQITVSNLPEGLSFQQGSIDGVTTRAGDFTVVVTATNQAGSVTRELLLTVLPGAPASVTAVSGSGQSTDFGTPFASPLVAQVVDAFGNRVPGVSVAFSSPANGAGTDPRVASAETDADGRATLAVSANDVPGAYDVTATVGGLAGVTFRLANRYRVGPFGAPLNGSDDPPIEVGARDTVPVSVPISDAAGPVSDPVALQLTTTCRVTFSSREVGGSPASSVPPRCLVYEPATRRFVYPASGTGLGWTSGKFYVLRVEVSGERPGDLLGLREVRIRVR